MDGVLCDFEKAVVETINRELISDNPKHPKLAAKVVADLGRNYITVEDINKYSPGKSRPAAKYMYTLVHDDEEWWANLPWMPGGKELWAYISKYDPDILTSPMDKAGKTESLSGKLTWVEKNLGLNADKVNFAHDKYKFAISPDGKPNILIDDFESKVNPWNEAGGIGILHLNSKNTINILNLLKDSDMSL
jgi:aromatic ring-cleaving dioxygenase